jgi:2-oxoglutarate ferredoxin oxidoreductase subunit delta
MATKNFREIKYEEKGLLWSVFPDLCKSCGYCIEKCPVKCLSFDSGHNDYLGTPIVKCKIEKCIACRTCENGCPEGAIRVEGKK